MLRADLILTAALIASPALAEEIPCQPYESLSSYLAGTFSEAQVALGIDDRGVIISIFVSDAGTWTLVATGPDSRSCVAGFGSDWTVVPAPKKGDLG